MCQLIEVVLFNMDKKVILMILSLLTEKLRHRVTVLCFSAEQ